MLRKILTCFLCVFLLLACSAELQAYSLLSHQAMIDAVWEDEIVPLLEKKYPGATAEQLNEAHAYAYGGAVMPDMGYYPLGSQFFTDLVHYVRTGDFTCNLLSGAANRQELAFALGVLAHYHGDVQGHSLGVNRAVPLVYPKTRKYYGNVVTYEEDPASHLRMEFGFDVLQSARGNYAPQAFRKFIGFKIAHDLLEQAFYQTYGLKLRRTFVYFPLSEIIFRMSVKGVIPQFTKVSWQWKDKEAVKHKGNQADQKVADLVRKSSFIEMLNTDGDKPGPSARLLAVLFRFVPKVGVLEPLNFKIPTPEAEDFFATSFEAALKNYQLSLRQLPEKLPVLTNSDLDSGLEIASGENAAADQIFSRLLVKLADNDFKTTSTDLKAYSLQYFAQLPPPADDPKAKKQWRKTSANLKKLQQGF